MKTFAKLHVVIRISVLYILLAYGNTCGRSEYKSSKGECCPMCNIGSVVFRDCIGDLSTTCIPCIQGTFMDKPNGFYDCSVCKHCSESKGLDIQSKCTTLQNSICDVLDGYHCIDFTNSECQHALKHSECKPGQETKTPGTKRSDTVCVDCPSGFYSPTGENCTRWTDCAAKNEFKTEAGNSIKDVTCTQQKRGIYGAIAAASVFTVILSIIYCRRLLMKKLKQPIATCELKLPTQEKGSPSSITDHMLEENKEDEETTVNTSTDHKEQSLIST